MSEINVMRRIDSIHTEIDEHFRAGRFEEVDVILGEADVAKMDINDLLSYLTATAVAKDKLSSRTDFYSRAEATIKERGEYESGLLDGLS